MMMMMVMVVWKKKSKDFIPIDALSISRSYSHFTSKQARSKQRERTSAVKNNEIDGFAVSVCVCLYFGNEKEIGNIHLMATTTSTTSTTTTNGSTQK